MRETATTRAREPARAVKHATNMRINMFVFLLFSLLWVAFAGALLFSRSTLDDTWEVLRELPWFVQVIVWLLLLPVVAGLWIWQQDWGLVMRLLLIAGLAVANLVAFSPWRSEAEQQAERAG